MFLQKKRNKSFSFSMAKKCTFKISCNLSIENFKENYFVLKRQIFLMFGWPILWNSFLFSIMLLTNFTSPLFTFFFFTVSAIDSFNECNEAFYPNIKALLQIFSTLLVSTATAERSFSVLKLIKNYLRSTISETRLNGLAFMYIYRNLSIDVETIITEFSRLKHRVNFCI
jgi:hypothetical protein